jgi:hypothetical protein
LNGKSILELPETAAFLEHFCITIDPLTEPEKFIEALRQLDPRYQGGRDLVRFELEQDQTQWPADAVKVIMDSAEALGLLKDETPLTGAFDLVIALGGARQSNLDRLRYAVESCRSGRSTIGRLVIAGSTRRINDPEKEAVANYAPTADTEADLCWAAARLVMRENAGLIIEVFIENNERAGNPEVIKGAILTQTTLSGRIGVVTTQIYRTAAELDLMRIAKELGIDVVMAAGNPSDPVLVAKRTTATYLSEILRTLRAAVLEATL